MSCVFCTARTEAGEVVYEDDHALVLLHPDWSPRGHAMVVAKRHAENASGLGEDEWLHVARVFRRAERVLLELTKADRAIVMKVGIQTPHLHLHIYPVSATATREDVFAAIDGKRADAHDAQFVAELRDRLTAESR